MKHTRFLLAILTLFLLITTEAEMLANYNVNLENVTEEVIAANEVNQMEDSDSSSEVSVLDILQFVLLGLSLIFVYYSISFHDGVGFSSNSVKNEEIKQRVLMPRESRTIEEKTRLVKIAVPFFCVAFVLLCMIVIYLINNTLDGDFLIYAIVAIINCVSLGIYIMRYRRSYFVMKGKIIRNIMDGSWWLLWGICMILIALGVDENGFWVLLSIIAFIFNLVILRAILKNCEIVRPDDCDEF